MDVGKHVDMTQTKKYRVVYAEMITYFVRHFKVAQCQTLNQPVPDPQCRECACGIVGRGPDLNVESARAELWEGEQTNVQIE